MIRKHPDRRSLALHSQQALISDISTHPLFLSDKDLITSRTTQPLRAVLSVFGSLSRDELTTFVRANTTHQTDNSIIAKTIAKLEAGMTKPIFTQTERIKTEVPFPTILGAHGLYYLITSLYQAEYNSSLYLQYGAPAKRDEGIRYYWEILFPHIPIDELFSESAEQLPKTYPWQFARNGNGPDENLKTHAAKHLPEITTKDRLRLIQLGAIKEGESDLKTYSALIQATLGHGCEIPLWTDPYRPTEEEVLFILDPKQSEHPFVVRAARKLSGDYCVITAYPLTGNRSELWRTKVVGQAQTKGIRDMLTYNDFAYCIWKHAYQAHFRPESFSPNEPHHFQEAYLDPVELYQPSL